MTVLYGKIKTASRWAGVLVPVLGMLTSPAFAQNRGQEAAPGERSVIEEVIVTARRVEESLQDTPVSVAAFSPGELEQLGTSELSDISRATPSLDIRKRVGGLQNVSMSIRGIGEGEASLAIDPTVGVYVDGVYIARSTGLDYDIVDLERIEVLRGPQGTLFGRNTIGGAVNLVTEKPRGEFTFKQQLSAGARERERYHTVVDTPRVGGVAAKFSFLHNERGGLVGSRYHDGELGQYQSDGYRIAINWSPVETFSLDYSYTLLRMENQPNINQISHVRASHADPDGEFYGGAYFETASAGSSSSRQSQVPSKDRGLSGSSDVDGQILTLEWQLNENLVFKSISGYRDWNGFLVTEFGTFPAPADGSLCASASPPDYDFGTGTCFNPVPAGQLLGLFESPDIDSRQDQITQELQFIGSAFDDRLRFIAGLYYFTEEAREVNPQQLVFSAAVASRSFAAAFGLPLDSLVPQNRGNSLLIELPFFRYNTENQSYAAYSDITVTVAPRLDVTLGLRFTRDEKQTVLRNTFGTEVMTVGSEKDWSQFNPALTLNYRWNDAVSTYAKAVTGYRSGGYNVRTTSPEAFAEPFDEENVMSYEFGWKADLLQRRLRFNGALFYMEYKDQQISSLRATASGASVDTVNAGEAVHTGAELELIWLPAEGWRVTASYGYLDIEFKEFLTQRLNPATGLPFRPGELEDISGSAEGSGPDNSAAVSVQYAMAPRSWGQLTFRIDANFTDNVLGDAQLNEFDVRDAHTLVNGRVTLSDIELGSDLSRLKIALWGRNLFNEVYREDGVDFGQVGFATNTYAELRSYGLDLVYQFNR